MRIGVHTGLQYTTSDDLQTLWRRIEALGFDWISIWDHFYSGDATRQRRRREERYAQSRGRHDPHRGRDHHEPGAVRQPRLLRPLPAPGGAREHDGDARPAVARTRDARARRGLAPERVRGLRVRVPAARRPSPHPRRGDPMRAAPAHRGRRELRGRALPAGRRPLRSEARPDPAAAVDRRRRREGVAAHRGDARGRMERRLHPARRVPAQGRGAGRALRPDRARSGRRSRSP